MKFKLNLKSLERFSKKVSAFPGKAQEALRKNDEEFMQKLLKAVIAKASGRPGPNIITGEYVSNFRIIENRVTNPSAQTNRLEYGYMGVDSLGRQYAQPPFPHFRPALQEVKPEHMRGIVQAIKAAWRAS